MSLPDPDPEELMTALVLAYEHDGPADCMDGVYHRLYNLREPFLDADELTESQQTILETLDHALIVVTGKRP